MELPSDKNQLRRHFKAVRAGLLEGERRAIDAAISGNVAGLPAFAEADAVFTYLSFGTEVDTRGLIERAWGLGKTVALPRVVPGTRQMRWYTVDSLDGLERSSFGVEEPAADPTREVTPRDFRTPIALVPGLAFDRAGYRLGYGGGFYDTFLPVFPGTSIGLCRAAQLVDHLPHDPRDMPVDLVVAECGWVTFSKVSS